MIGKRVAAVLAACLLLGACDDRPSDPGGDPCENLVQYSIGQTVNGNLTQNDCVAGDNSFVDFYRFTLTSSQTVTITLRSNDFDSYLFLYRLDGTLVTQDDDSDPQTELGAQVQALLTPGTYIIAANSFDAGETGSYQVSSTGF